MSDITIVTASLGRPSLAKLAICVAAQAVKPIWLVVFDGSESYEAGKQYLPADAQTFVTHEGPPRGPSGEVVRMKALDKIETKYVTFMDDDNQFDPLHVANLLHGFKQGARFVGVRRLYTDANMVPIAKEHVNSELVDTNCSAIEIQLLKDASEFAKQNWDMSRPFYDRNLQGYLLARGITALIVPVWTVLYKINPKDNPEWSRGHIVFETLASIRFHFGNWDMKTGAAPILP